MVMDSDGLVLPRAMEPLATLLLRAFPELNNRYTIPHVGLVLADIIQAAEDGQSPDALPHL